MKIYNVTEAQATILKRHTWDEIEIPECLLNGIEAIFGERVTPEEVVRRILADVRQRGDVAIVEWMKKIDRIDVLSLVVGQPQIEAAYEQIAPGKVNDFIKIVSVVGLNEAALQAIGPAAEMLAHTEGLIAHTVAVARRLR